MDLLVVGTSNCIGKGTFVSHLESASIKIANCSIGASSSNCALFSVFTLPEIRFDFALLDMSINDREFWRFKKKDFDDIRANIQTIVHHLRKHDCVPIIVVLPQCAKASLDENSPVADLYREVAATQKVFYVDIARLFSKAYLAGIDTSLLMRDPYHMSGRLTHLVSKVFLDTFSILEKRRSHLSKHTCEIRHIKAVSAIELSHGLQLIRRESSHRAADYVRLCRQDHLDIPLDAESEVMGVLLNTGAFGSKVQLQTNHGAVIKSFVIFFDRQNPDSFKTIMVDFKPHLRSEDGTLRMSLVDVDARTTESTLYEQAPVPGRYGQVEIEGFLIGGRELTRVISNARIWLDVDLDVLKTLDEADYLDTIVASCGPQT